MAKRLDKSCYKYITLTSQCYALALLGFANLKHDLNTDKERRACSYQENKP